MARFTKSAVRRVIGAAYLEAHNHGTEYGSRLVSRFCQEVDRSIVDLAIFAERHCADLHYADKLDEVEPITLAFVDWVIELGMDHGGLLFLHQERGTTDNRYIGLEALQRYARYVQDVHGAGCNDEHFVQIVKVHALIDPDRLKNETIIAKATRILTDNFCTEAVNSDLLPIGLSLQKLAGKEPDLEIYASLEIEEL